MVLLMPDPNVSVLIPGSVFFVVSVLFVWYDGTCSLALFLEECCGRSPSPHRSLRL
jgi:hypothetical protein